MKKQIAVTIILVTLLFLTPLFYLRQQVSEKKVEETACQIDVQVIGTKKPIALEEYVKGVVAAEMPIGFHKEALKAQAIAARTYVLKTSDYGKKPIATDVSAQVFHSKKERQEKWGKKFTKNEQIVEEVVEQTAAQVIVFEDELITAMFFSTSNGQTENAENFSGQPIPYLQTVSSPGENEIAPLFEEQKSFTLAQWSDLLGEQWTADMFSTLKLVRNSSGRVQKVITSKGEFEGRELRTLLNLRSTDFNIAFDILREEVHVTTVGYGHGVGMSQYGAEVFAQEGWTAEQILAHYYTKTKIKKLTNNDPACLK